MTTSNSETKEQAQASIPLREFYESVPPGKFFGVSDLLTNKQYSSSGKQFAYLSKPEITLFCEHEQCGGYRQFKTDATVMLNPTERKLVFVTYSCKNCSSINKTFAVSLTTEDLESGHIYKYGEYPAFGPPTPARLITLIGPDREAFLQGRRAENSGLGIGAFAYYRRVVENQKNRIIAEIARVARTLGSTPETDTLFESATRETQFSKSVEMVNDVIPQALMINGRNPLTLLHSALSKGLHDDGMTDDRCLQIAQSIRTILGELAERAAAALKSDREIQAALSTLMAAQSAAGSQDRSLSARTHAVPAEPADEPK